MAFFGKEIREAKVRKFQYTVLDKEYIVEVEKRYSDAINGDMYEFYLHRVGYGIKSHIIGFPADQTKAKINPKYYSLEEALEIVEDNLMGDINMYEDEMEYLENRDMEDC